MTNYSAMAFFSIGLIQSNWIGGGFTNIYETNIHGIVTMTNYAVNYPQIVTNDYVTHSDGYNVLTSQTRTRPGEIYWNSPVFTPQYYPPYEPPASYLLSASNSAPRTTNSVPQLPEPLRARPIINAAPPTK